MQRLYKKLVLLCTALSLTASASHATGGHHNEYLNHHDLSAEHIVEKGKDKKHFTEEDKKKIIYIEIKAKKSVWEILGKTVFTLAVLGGTALIALKLYKEYENSQKSELEREFQQGLKYVKRGAEDLKEEIVQGVSDMWSSLKRGIREI